MGRLWTGLEAGAPYSLPSGRLCRLRASFGRGLLVRCWPAEGEKRPEMEDPRLSQPACTELQPQAEACQVPFRCSQGMHPPDMATMRRVERVERRGGRGLGGHDRASERAGSRNEQTHSRDSINSPQGGMSTAQGRKAKVGLARQGRKGYILGF